MSLKRQRSPEPVNPKPSSQTAHDNNPNNVYKSAKIEDRASIFIAYFSPTVAPRDLQAHSLLRSADHRMLAWRTPGSQRTLFAKSRALESGFDDDGETYGGKRILKVLDEMLVEGSLVVARWYGGIMLGPVRFTHIEDVTRDAIHSWQQAENEAQKRRKLESEVSEKAALVDDLKERDQSIKVLRGLLEEAKMAAKGETDPSNSSVLREPATAPGLAPIPGLAPAREIDYSSISLEQLRRLDKARDNTIAFLLKRIDEAEKQAVKPENQEKQDTKTDDQEKDGTQQVKEDEKVPFAHTDPLTTTEKQFNPTTDAD